MHKAKRFASKGVVLFETQCVRLKGLCKNEMFVIYSMLKNERFARDAMHKGKSFSSK